MNRRQFNLQQWQQRLKVLAARTWWGYSKEELIQTLRQLGVAEGDALMVHCGWRATNGFRGEINDLIDALIAAVGSQGTLAMMSMAYQGISSAEYLQQGKPFDVRHSISMVGLPTEIFRRRHDVIRGLHPTHSVAAWGAKAEWLVAGQGQELSPFDSQSPFARLIELNGKILLFDVPFNTMTFEHYLEHQIQSYLPLDLYQPHPVVGKVIDRDGRLHKIKTLVLNERLHQIRRSNLLEAELLKRGALRQFRLGRTSLTLGNAKAMTATLREMLQEGGGFHLSVTRTPRIKNPAYEISVSGGEEI